MEGLIGFEQSIYCNEPVFGKSELVELDFYIEKLINHPRLRPHFLDSIVDLCLFYCNSIPFREILLEKSFTICHVLIHRLYLSGVYSFNEINEYLKNKSIFIPCYYYRKEIFDFNIFIGNKTIPVGFEREKWLDESFTNLCIKFGFAPSTIEFCLKYDDIESLLRITSDSTIILPDTVQWSPFEWSHCPKSLDILSFSGFFGSVRCFKFLLMKGYCIDQNTICSVIYSGQLDEFYICHNNGFDCSDYIDRAAEFCRIELFRYMIDNRTERDLTGAKYLIYRFIRIL